MTHSRRIIAPFVVLALLCALGLTALPLRAQTLNSIGLFKGYDESGNNFGLTDIPTREQALYSDVTSSNPVTAWSVPYLYGMGEGQFGYGQPATAQMLSTFIW